MELAAMLVVGGLIVFLGTFLIGYGLRIAGVLPANTGAFEQTYTVEATSTSPQEDAPMVSWQEVVHSTTKASSEWHPSAFTNIARLVENVSTVTRIHQLFGEIKSVPSVTFKVLGPRGEDQTQYELSRFIVEVKPVPLRVSAYKKLLTAWLAQSSQETHAHEGSELPIEVDPQRSPSPQAWYLDPTAASKALH